MGNYWVTFLVDFNKYIIFILDRLYLLKCFKPYKGGVWEEKREGENRRMKNYLEGRMKK